MSLSALELSLVLLALVAVPLARAYARIGDEQLARWAGAHALELTDENRRSSLATSAGHACCGRGARSPAWSSRPWWSSR